MSRAFVKEDVEIVERTTRQRSPSGLPPGATNYMTQEGADQLRNQLKKLKSISQPDEDAISELESILASATIVKPSVRPGEAIFGSTVTLRTEDGSLITHRIVGVDEVELHPGGVSWVSPLGRALLRSELNQPLILDDNKKGFRIVVKIE